MPKNFLRAFHSWVIYYSRINASVRVSGYGKSDRGETVKTRHDRKRKKIQIQNFPFLLFMELEK